jgi:hypothetical protein
MATVKTSNSPTNVNSLTGGAIRVTIAATVGQGNGGTSQPCRECWISLPDANTGPVRMNIGVAASATVGIEVPEASSPFRVPIDDVSKLYFYSATNGDIIDILWRT